MSRLFPILAVLSLAACVGNEGDTASTEVEPTTEFAIEIPGDGIDNDGDGEIDESVVDTDWPSYTGGRRRNIDTGWRTLPVRPFKQVDRNR